MQTYETLTGAPMRVFNLDPEIERLRASQPGQVHSAPESAAFARQIVEEAERRGEDWQRYEVGVALQRVGTATRLVDFRAGDFHSVGLALSGPDYPVDGHTHTLALPPSGTDLTIFGEDSYRLASVVVDKDHHTYFLVKSRQYAGIPYRNLSSKKNTLKAALADLPWFMEDRLKGLIWNIYPFSGLKFNRDRNTDHLVRVAEPAGIHLFTGHYSSDTLIHYVPRR